MKIKLILLSAFLLAATLALTFTLTASAAIPHLVNYQGKATDKSGMPLNGTYNLTFRIYNAETGGTPKWSETQAGIPISNGIFQVQLGSTTTLNLPFDESYWISIEINTDGEMTPRTRLASVPYAYRAESLADTPVIPFYKKGFDIEYIDFNSVKIAPGVMDVAGKMFTTAAYSNSLQLVYLDDPANRDWIHGQKTNNSVAYIYAYNNNGQIAFKLSDESPDMSDNLGNTVRRPFLYQRYPDTVDGIYYRYIGNLTINAAGAINAVISQGNAEPASIFSAFGGNGTGGDVVVSSDTNFSTIDDPTRPGIAQYRNLTINTGNTLTIDTGIAHIGVSGALTVHGTITAVGQGAAGGTYNGYAGKNAEGVGNNGIAAIGQNYTDNSSMWPDIAISNATHTIIGGLGTQQWKIENCVTGAGGAGGNSGGGGGGAGGWGTQSNSRLGIDGGATAPGKILKLTGGLGDNSTHSTFFNPVILQYVGAGGGAGGNWTYIPGGLGGAGGGCIYIECNELVFDGTITADGANGGAGASGVSTSGNGGGGGGGIAFVRANTITTNSGTISAAGGIDNPGGYPGGHGAAGFKDIVAVQ